MIKKLKCFFDREQNLLIIIGATILVTIFGIVFKISFIEWLLVMVCIAFVISAELMNSSIELAVDNYTLKKNNYAKIAKDVGAGAALISAVTAFIIGLYVFIPKVISMFK